MKKQLTAADRGKIEVLLQENYSYTAIAKAIGKHKSTISREVRARGTPNGYFAETAHVNYKTKQMESSKNARKIQHSSTRNYILGKLYVGWSPEQISGKMRNDRRTDYVCMETIYRYIYEEDYCKEEKLYQYFRRGKKKRTSWKGRKTHKCKIPNRTSIDKRPEIVDERSEFGHWETDSVLYANKRAINTMNELKTGYVEFTKLERKTAELTKEAMLRNSSNHKVLTITADNGSEHMLHTEVTEKTGIQVYFCHPYSSWERGANENANMLLRGYLPKRSNIDKLTQGELDDIANELNTRPRKRLNYMTPAEAYQQELNLNVASRSRM